MFSVAIIFALCVVQRCFDFVKRFLSSLRYNAIFRSYFEMYLDLQISCLINIISLDCSNSFRIASMVVAIAVCIGLLYVPLFNASFILRNRQRLNTYKSRFGTLFDSYKYDRIAALMYQVIFIARRLLYVMIIVIGRNNGPMQCMYLFALNISKMFYSFAVRPMNTSHGNFILCFSESVVAFITVILFEFRELQRGTRSLTSAFLVVGSVGGLALVTFLSILTKSIIEACKKWKKNRKPRETEVLT